MSSASGLPPESKLVPGAPRLPVGAPGGPPPRNTDNDIWAADLHLTPNGKFLYMTERTSNSSLRSASMAQRATSFIWALRPPRNSPAVLRLIPREDFSSLLGKSRTRFQLTRSTKRAAL